MSKPKTILHKMLIYAANMLEKKHNVIIQFSFLTHMMKAKLAAKGLNHFLKEQKPYFLRDKRQTNTM